MLHGEERHRVLELALLLEVAQEVDERAHALGRPPQQPERIGKAGRQLRDLVGGGRAHDLRIAVLVEGRRRLQVGSGAPWREHDVDLVDAHQALDQAHHVLVVGAVVDLARLDGHALVVLLEHQAAGLVDLVDPQPVVRHGGEHGAGRLRARQRDHIADLDRLGCLLCAGAGRRRAGKQRCRPRETESSAHPTLPEIATRKSEALVFRRNVLVGIPTGQAGRPHSGSGANAHGSREGSRAKLRRGVGRTPSGARLPVHQEVGEPVLALLGRDGG